MQSDCTREPSKACFSVCCVNPLLSLPHPHSSPPTTVAAADPRRDFVSAILSSIQPNSNFTNHESLPSLTQLFTSLKNAVPNYLTTVLADSIRAQEYYHLSLSNHVSLDYVGHGLFSYSQKQGRVPTTETATSSSSTVTFINVSHSAVSLNSYLLHGNQESEFQSTMRRRIMRYMNVLEEDYSLVFTANQSSAFKILADSYPFHSNQNLLTVYDHDNEAVQLMIDSAKKGAAGAQSAVFTWPKFRINSKRLRKSIVMNKSKNKRNRGLFAFPLQSRITGSRYSYQWMTLARENGWHVLLDASALGAKEMETLGLSLFQPDFIICSFFKIFGEDPSGFCCLFIKKSSVSDLIQSSTGIGIITIVPADDEKSAIDESQETKIVKQNDPSSSEIVQLTESTESTQLRGLDHADELGLILISSRVRYLVNWLVNALLSLRHPNSGNGLPLVMIYGPRIKVGRGSAVAFNVFDWKRTRVDPILVQKLADRNNISLTLGFLKNIWLPENLEENERAVLENLERENCGVRVVSVSVGMLSNFEDVYRVWGFVSKFLDADFVEKERWRYTALNQTTVEV